MNLFSQSMLGTAYTCTAHVPIALHVLYVRLLSTIMIGEHHVMMMLHACVHHIGITYGIQNLSMCTQLTIIIIVFFQS